MRILFILEHFYPQVGGVETLFAALGQELVKQGHQVRVIATKKGDSPRHEHWRGIHISRVNAKNRYFFTFLALRTAWQLAGEADLVHTTSYNAAPTAWLAAKLRRKPVIISFHEAWGKLWFRLPFVSKLFQWAHYIYEQALLQLSFQRFIAVSDATQQALEREGVDPKRIIRIYNGIDYTDFPAASTTIDSSIFTVTYLGRMGISKGIDLLMQAQLLLADVPDLHFQYITSDTDSSVYKRLRAFIKKNSLGTKTHFIEHAGFEKVKACLQKSQAVIIPSYSEGFCYVAVEAAALKAPIIHSGQAALCETVSGKHIKMADLTAEALAGAILDAKDGNWQLNPLRTFPLAETVQGYVELYDQVLAQS